MRKRFLISTKPDVFFRAYPYKLSDFQMGDEIFRRMIFMTGHKGQSVPSARYTFLLSFAFIR